MHFKRSRSRLKSYLRNSEQFRYAILPKNLLFLVSPFLGWATRFEQGEEGLWRRKGHEDLEEGEEKKVTQGKGLRGGIEWNSKTCQQGSGCAARYTDVSTGSQVSP